MFLSMYSFGQFFILSNSIKQTKVDDIRWVASAKRYIATVLSSEWNQLSTKQSDHSRFNANTFDKPFDAPHACRNRDDAFDNDVQAKKGRVFCIERIIIGRKKVIAEPGRPGRHPLWIEWYQVQRCLIEWENLHGRARKNAACKSLWQRTQKVLIKRSRLNGYSPKARKREK